MHGKSWRWLYLSRICYWESPYLTASCSPCTFMLFLKKNVNMALISHWKEKRESWASIAWGIWTKKYFLLRIPAEVRLGPSMLVSLGVESLLEHRAGGDPVHHLGWFFSCGCLFFFLLFPSLPFLSLLFPSFPLPCLFLSPLVCILSAPAAGPRMLDGYSWGNGHFNLEDLRVGGTCNLCPFSNFENWDVRLLWW